MAARSIFPPLPLIHRKPGFCVHLRGWKRFQVLIKRLCAHKPPLILSHPGVEGSSGWILGVEILSVGPRKWQLHLQINLALRGGENTVKGSLGHLRRLQVLWGGSRKPWGALGSKSHPLALGVSPGGAGSSLRSLPSQSSLGSQEFFPAPSLSAQGAPPAPPAHHLPQILSFLLHPQPPVWAEVGMKPSGSLGSTPPRQALQPFLYTKTPASASPLAQ